MKKKELLKEVLQRIEALEAFMGAEKKTEIGRWYVQNIGNRRWLLNYQSDTKSINYGFLTEKLKNTTIWGDDFGTAGKDWWIEATHKEVETALIKEAKKRYQVNFYGFEFDNNVLFGHYDDNKVVELFNNGKWIENIGVDKFAELKEAHNNGAVMQYFSVMCNDWKDVDNPSWNDVDEYRIKPDDKPKVGDVVKVVVSGGDCEFITRIYDIVFKNKYTIVNGWYVDSITKLTEQEVIKLLF